MVVACHGCLQKIRHMNDEGACYLYAAKAGSIGNSQTNFMEVVKTIPAVELNYLLWVSSETFYDGLRFLVDLNHNGNFEFDSSQTLGLKSGIPIDYASARFYAKICDEDRTGDLCWWTQ